VLGSNATDLDREMHLMSDYIILGQGCMNEEHNLGTKAV